MFYRTDRTYVYNLTINYIKICLDNMGHFTPLALMTFILDNRREEISPAVCQRLEYIRSQMQEDVEKMLYYSRIKSAHMDYRFIPLPLFEICSDIMEDYQFLTGERSICVVNKVGSEYVLSDKNGVSFLIKQVISNAIKYSRQKELNPFIMLYTETERESGAIILTIRDNGIGAKAYEMPFLFDKGFTGDTGENRKNSTGMGLYLAKQVAGQMNIKLEVVEEYMDGFEIQILFPMVEEIKMVVRY